MAETFHCSVVTPERAVLECDATSAVFPAHDGEVGILPRRAPLLCRLGTGILRVETEGKPQRFFIDGGFGQMVDNKLTLLTEQARATDEIKLEAARQALDDARALPVEDGYDQRQVAIERARVQVKLVEPESPY
ncbi:MAG: ATP synthase F1 subunit epsilon [bacterium]|nr:ATP synthase F1 subunit epsilon [bacterium]